MNIKLLLSIVPVFFVAACAQINSKVAKEPKTTEVQWSVSAIEGQVNSEYHDTWSTVTEDELTLYFGSNRPGGFVKSNIEDGWGLGVDGTPTRYDMYVSHRDSINSDWGNPILLPATVNTKHNEHSAAVSPDGHYLFFASGRPGGCGSLDLYVSYRDNVEDDQAWQEAKNLGCQTEGGPNGAAIDSCPIFHFDDKTNDIKLYFTASTTPNPATLDFKYTVFDKETMSAKGEQTINISTKEYLDGHIDPKFGYVWAAYPTGKGGSDIWVSDRTDHPDEWRKPVNLGSSINTEYEEQLPSPVNDGNKLYFPSNRPGGKGGFDIYQASKK